jgi:hypothetical protein
MAIPIQEARGVFTKVLVARWNELSELAPKVFLSSFLQNKQHQQKKSLLK